MSDLCFLISRWWNQRQVLVNIWGTPFGTQDTPLTRCVYCGRIPGTSAGKTRFPTAGSSSTGRRLDTSGTNTYTSSRTRPRSLCVNGLSSFTLCMELGLASLRVQIWWRTLVWSLTSVWEAGAWACSASLRKTSSGPIWSTGATVSICKHRKTVESSMWDVGMLIWFFSLFAFSTDTIPGDYQDVLRAQNEEQ